MLLQVGFYNLIEECYCFALALQSEFTSKTKTTSFFHYVRVKLMERLIVLQHLQLKRGYSTSRWCVPPK